MAVLTPVAFARSRPDARTQTWWLAVYRDAAAWRRNRDSMIFAAEGWADAA